MFAIGAMVIWGLTRVLLLGDPVRAESADLELLAEGDAFTGMALVLLVLRSFTQGAAALTGVEAISNGVPAFRKPKSKNAATTLLLLGLLSVTMFMGLIALAQVTGVKIAEDPEVQFPDAPPGYEQHTMIAQLADAVFAGFRPGYFIVVITTALILVLAANTAFNGFPVLGSILVAGPLPAAPAAHPRRPAGLLQRHRHPRRVRRRAGDRVPGRGDAADPALHRRCVRLLHAQPDGHGPALAAPPAHRDRPGGAPPDAPRPGDQRRSAP